MTKGQKIALGVTIGIPLVCGLGGLGVMQGLFGSAAASRDHELELARRDGMPTTAADLSAMTHAAEAENAAPFYRKACTLVSPGTSLSKDLALIDAALARSAKEKDRAAAAAVLPALLPAIALVRQGAALPHCDFRREWSLGASLQFREYSPLKSLSKALCFEARRRSQAGDWRGALNDLVTVERLSHHVSEDPILIAMLVSISIEAIAEASLRHIVDDHSRDAAFLTEAKKVHDGFGQLADFRRAISGEMAEGRTMLGHIRGLPDFDMSGNARTPHPLETAVFQSGIVQRAFDARLIRSYRRLVEALPRDSRLWEDSERAAKATEGQLEADHSLANLANQMMMPVLSQSTEAIGMQLTRRNLTDTALRLLLDRTTTGRLPRFLPNYGSSRMDPFSGKPLVYRREGNGFLLYSVGPDRVDDGGKEATSATVGTAGVDEVFRVH